jgi:EH domain-containing protein 1
MARDDDDDDANKGEPLPLAKLEGVDATGYTNRLESIQHEVQKDKGAFYLTLVPIRPRRRGERRSLRTFAVVSLRPGSLAFNPRPYDAFQLQLTPLNSTPTFARVERPKAMNKQRAAERDAANGNHGKKNRMSAKTATSIVDSLKELYKTKVRPVEEALKFGSFYSPLLTDGDFEGKPNVLLLGQYSTGKTTFIKHLLGRDYPGSNIGPEPTTDRFVVVMHGHENRTTPGQTLAVQSDKPYTGLTAFGSSFLSKFEASQCDAKILEEVSIVDTPGVLSGEKQRIDRGYSFVNVCEWFASRSDVILLLFDPHKLDISDEFKAVISSLRGHDDKVRVVLNKADQVSAQQLMRVYGALMWSLGKVFMTPEVCKVYVGSFNDKPPVTTNNVLGEELFMKEHEALKKDLLDIPQRSCDRKVNEFVKRVRAALTHARIVTHLKKQMPAMMGHESKQKKLLGRIEEEFTKCVHEYTIARGDLPNPKRFRDIMKDMEIWKFPKIDKKAMKALEEVLTVDIPAVMKKFDNPF